ncbi:hypothetical protein B484DRAFT_393285 [Ochromonadaceae sp. CCMP2298]|nr:hypothetical protein B484DRAFT_393285 [Ochromonadaceae sp. CCMP2298]
MCSSKELRDAVSATLLRCQAIIYERTPFVYNNPAREYGPTLKQWLRHYSSAVTSLTLRDCNFLNDEACKLLAARFPLLERLDLSGCDHATSIGAKRFFKGCKSLSYFRSDVTHQHNTRKNFKVNPSYVKAIAESKSLTSLSLTLGSKNRISALASLHQHPSLQELNLYFLGFYSISLDIHLPSLQRLKMYRGDWSPYSWRHFFQTLCKSGGVGGSSGGSSVSNPLCNLPNLQFLQIHSGDTQLTPEFGVTSVDCALQWLLCPEVQAILPRSKLVSIVMSPCTAAQLSQWQALGPRNSLGHLITLTIGESWFEQI